MILKYELHSQNLECTLFSKGIFMDTIMFSKIIRRKRHLTNLFYNESEGLKLTNAAANATKAQQIRHHMADKY